MSEEQGKQEKQPGWWKRRGTVTKVLIIVAAVFVAFIFFLMVLGASYAPEEYADETGTDTEEVTEEAGDETLTREQAAETSPGVGSTVTFNDWEITLKEVQTHSTIGNEAPRGKFLVLMIEATNDGATERELSGGVNGGWTFVDVDEDRNYQYDSEASLAHHHAYETDAWHHEKIGPGLTATVPIAFDVPEDISWGLASMTQGEEVSKPFFVKVD